MNWTLISGLFSALHSFEENHEWDMSVGENARFAEALYESFIKGLPETKYALEQAFMHACEVTWGKDHNCDQPQKEELLTLLDALSDYFFEENQKVEPMAFIQYMKDVTTNIP